MKRKVLQDFANTVCQKYIDLNSGFDAAAFAYYGSGVALMDFLSGNCTFNGKPIATLKSCSVLKDWLHQRFVAHNIDVGEIALAQMTVTVAVSNLDFSRPWDQVYSGYFEFHCSSEIRTDEKTYVGQMSGEKGWGFMEEYDVLRTRLEVG